MQTVNITREQIEKMKLHAPAYDKFVNRYQNDADLRTRIDGGDVADSLLELGFVLPPGIEARIVANTADTFHVVMPPDPNAELSDEALSMVAGGKSASSAGSAGSVGTVSSVGSCAGTISTAGSAASAGSAS